MGNIKQLLLSALLFIGVGLRAETQVADAAVTTLNIVGGSNTYTIVYKNGDATAKSHATELQKAIKNKTGVTLDVKTDATTASDYEIVLGPTNARGEVVQQNLWLATFGYRIVIVGKKVVITANDNNHMVLALKRFEDAILKNANLAGIGFLTFTSAYTQIAEYAHTQATLRTILANGVAHEELTTTKTITIAEDGEWDNAQGICTDGTYVYVAQRKGESSTKIFKCNLSDGKRVGLSDGFAGGHCNDICYDHINHRIICLAWDSRDKDATIKTYYAIDAATLAVTKGTTTLPGAAVEIDFNKELSKYVIRCGNTIKFVDSNLKTELSSVAVTAESDYTEQGMGADAQFIYCPRTNGGSYIELQAFDWDGNYKKTFKVKMSVEAESMIEVNGVYYLNCYLGSGGTYLYKININLKYTTSITA